MWSVVCLTFSSPVRPAEPSVRLLGGPVHGEVAAVLWGEPCSQRLGSRDQPPRALSPTEHCLSTCWNNHKMEILHPLEAFYFLKSPDWTDGSSRGGFPRSIYGQNGSAGPGLDPPLRGLSSRPCQDDSHSLCEWGPVCHERHTQTLILCADEVWREMEKWLVPPWC